MVELYPRVLVSIPIDPHRPENCELSSSSISNREQRQHHHTRGSVRLLKLRLTILSTPLPVYATVLPATSSRVVSKSETRAKPSFSERRSHKQRLDSTSSRAPRVAAATPQRRASRPLYPTSDHVLVYRFLLLETGEHCSLVNRPRPRMMPPLLHQLPTSLPPPPTTGTATTPHCPPSCHVACTSEQWRARHAH